MTTYTKTQAKEADARLAERQQVLYKASAKVSSTFSSLTHYAGARTTYIGRTSFPSFDGRTRASREDILIRAREIAAPAGRYNAIQCHKLLADLTADEAARDAARNAVEESHQEWLNNGQWNRFFLVEGGHIHSSTGCSSLRPTTQIAWLPELSGETEAEAVEMFGSVLCSICFPSAPVEHTTGKVKTRAQREKEARAAERAAKAAEKAAKMVLDPETGEPIRDVWGSQLKTERSVSNAILSEMNSLRWYGDTHPDADKWKAFIDRAVKALAAKQGRDADELLAEFNAKADKKFARESR